jgi:hypothetical protein
MKSFFTLLLCLGSYIGFTQEIDEISDTIVFWEFAATLPENEKADLQHTWGSETVHFLGTVKFISPSGKELDLRIVSSYRRITKANGFNDQSVLALVKTNNVPVKIYDFVSRQNLPIGIRDNGLVYKIKDAEKVVPLPAKLGERLCVEGLSCFAEAILVEI